MSPADRLVRRLCRATLVMTACVASVPGLASPGPRLELEGEGHSAFDAINVRYFAPSLDQCFFNREHTVEFTEGEIRIELKPMKFPFIGCLLAIPVQRYPVYVGRLPAGNYRITASVAQPEPGSPLVIPEQGDRVSIDIELPPRTSAEGHAPLYDYSGAYWSPDESGWQLNVFHQDNDQLTIVWAVYDDDTKPIWYFALPGAWTASDTYQAPLARTTAGPPVRSNELSDVGVESEVVGTVELAGDALPGLLILYVIDGLAHSRRAVRYVQPAD